MKNKGYYSWIHAINQAGLQAQQRGAELLKEAKKAGRSAKPFTIEYDPKAHAEIGAQKIAQGEEAANIKRSQTQLANLGRPVNLAPIGDANAERMQHDEIPEILDTSNAEDSDEADFLLQGKQAREILAIAKENQAARWAKEDEESDMEAAADFADEMTGAGHGPLSRGAGRHPYRPTSEQLPESVSQKIKRILKG
jgi:hypothetical protein